MTLKSFIVAEIASNWEGNFSKAQKLIQESKNAGANAVKFQMWRANDLYNNKHPNWKFIKKSEITFEKAKKLKQIADKTGIEFFCSAFYPEAINFLEKLKVKRYKIASRTCLLKDPHSLETLQEKSLTKKPVIISMGMGGNKNKIKKIFSKNKITFCYCVSEYPTAMNKIKWNEAKKFDGFSDHTLGIIAPIIFTILKKQREAKNIIIEKHVKLKNSRGPDASSSIDTSEFTQMISAIRKIEKLKFKS
jgi:sialic acid synthase SpsE|tara:strand:- start:1938 stop:2681 length:744 start_codon:yes stop_codon:yes gene_type:complete